jgi:periplasmic protein TonB
MSAAPALQSQAPNSRLWGRAAAGALALHLFALGAAIVGLRGELDDDEMGSPAIEISLAPAAPRVADAPDEPPGPLADEAAAAAPSVASSESKVTDEPKIARAEAEDAEFSRRETPEKPVENSPAPQAKPVLSNESSASEATAPPKSDVKELADTPVAPVVGADAAARAVKLTWQKALMAHLNRVKRYPAGSRRSVEVAVVFTLDRVGHIVSYSLKHPSGQAAFDDAALAMMKKADPVPPPPAIMADEGLSFEVPVVFRAERR